MSVASAEPGSSCSKIALERLVATAAGARRTDANLPGACVIEHVPDAIGLMAWLFRDQFITRIEADIDQNADDTNALTEQQRQEAEAQINADLLATERAETTLIFAAQREGASVEHRPDANALALLALELVTAAPLVVASDT